MSRTRHEDLVLRLLDLDLDEAHDEPTSLIMRLLLKDMQEKLDAIETYTCSEYMERRNKEKRTT